MLPFSSWAYRNKEQVIFPNKSSTFRATHYCPWRTSGDTSSVTFTTFTQSHKQRFIVVSKPNRKATPNASTGVESIPVPVIHTC